MAGSGTPQTSALERADLVDLYLELRPKLERVIARRLGSLIVAADLAQEIFLKIDTIQISLPTRKDAERYFLRVAINIALDHLKVEGRRRALLRSTAAETPAITLLSPDRVMLAREELRRLEQALDELPERCGAAFRLSRIIGLSHAEIAGQLGVSKSLVEKYVVRALLHCRAKLSE